jgi:lipopolysaccharide export system protein LptC
MVMAVVAAATWWLVQNAPSLDTPRPAAIARVDPDVEMTGVRIQRFAPDGRLRTQIEGERLRHFPATDTLEIDAARIRSVDEAGRVTVATARRALSNADGSEVQLLGDAEVVREGTGGDEAVRFQGEFLHAFRNAEQLRSHLPGRGDAGRLGGARRPDGVRPRHPRDRPAWPDPRDIRAAPRRLWGRRWRVTGQTLRRSRWPS